ncbi:MAG: type II toxin-antitoxin system prevent-host-death family antitoxin [Solirubrobacteraceae bacterium]
MREVSIRELRNSGGAVVDQVGRGESLVVTRDGKPVAELHPVAAPSLSSRMLLERWSHLPPVEPAAFRKDVDALLDTEL